MKIVILVAMDKELELLLSIMPDRHMIEIDGKKYYRGEISGKEIVAGKCGIGKVNSALNTLRVIESEHPDLVINSGVAGGASGRLHIGDVLVADRVAYHDVWCGPGTSYGQADGYPLYLLPHERGLKIAAMMKKEGEDINFGLICSGDKFIHSAEEVAEIHGKFPDALAVDMESASIAQTCVSENVPFMIVRVMSDTPGEGDNVSQYKDFWGEAPRKTFASVESLIEKL